MKEKKLLMIIDDDSDDRFFFSEALIEINSSYVCQEAMHGADAIEKLDHSVKLPDYIFLDLNMPVMDGKNCLIELKKNLRFQKIPVIILSTSISDRTISELGILGASFFMIKPMDIILFSKGILSAILKVENQFRETIKIIN